LRVTHFPPQARPGLLDQLRAPGAGVELPAARLELDRLVAGSASKRPCTSRQAARPARAGRGSGAGSSSPGTASADLVAQLEREALGDLAPDAADLGEAGQSPPVMALTSSGSGSPARMATATRGPTPAREQRLEDPALVASAKP
jgi:hypothetical protein